MAKDDISAPAVIENEISVEQVIAMDRFIEEGLNGCMRLHNETGCFCASLQALALIAAHLINNMTDDDEKRMGLIEMVRTDIIENAFITEPASSSRH